MNYLSHHTVARAALPDAQPAFYLGNLLPDLLAVSGEGRIRALPARPEESGDEARYLRLGVALHIETDRQFHAATGFAAAMARAGELLKATPFETPPRRVFFLAHAFVEIALDGWLIRRDPAIADDLYTQLERCDLVRAVDDTGALMGLDTPLLGLARILEGFLESRYLVSYAQTDGLAAALARVACRAKLPDQFVSDADRCRLAECFDRYIPTLPAIAGELLATPPRTSWYNSGEFS